MVFSSETVIPRDYFIDEVREHIQNMKGRDLTAFHRRLERNKLFYVPESETDHRSLGRSYCGRAAFSLLLPSDLNFDNGKVKIEGGILVKGTVSKSEIGAFSHSTIFHELTRLYGFEICSQVMDCLVWFTKTYLTRGNTISFNLEDYGFVGRDAERETDRIVWVRKLVSEYQSVYQTLKTLALDYKPQLDAINVKVSINRILQDVRRLRATEEVKGFLAEYCAVEDETTARNLLLAAATLEEKNESVYQEVRVKVETLERQKKDAVSKREFKKVEEIEGKIIDLLNGIRAQEAKNIESVVDPDNAFMTCEGKRGNIFEVMGSVGLQTVSGKRIYTGSASNRALPSIFPGDTSPEALGMVLGNFTRGLDPSESAFLSWAARIGPVVTKTQTSVIGDIANRMTNAFQGIVMKDGAPQETVREMSNVVQMAYNYDNVDPKYLLVRKGDQQFADSLPSAQRSDYKADKPGQTAIDVSNIQVGLSAMGGTVSQLGTAEEVATVNAFLKSRVINGLSMATPPTDGSVYVVRGVSFVTAQKSVENVRNMLRQAVMSLKFPDDVAVRGRVIEDTLEDVLTRMTGVKRGTRVVENVHIGQGDKVGRFISGAIQQPIMQAALNSVVWEEKVVVRESQKVHVKPIGEFIDYLLQAATPETVQRYSLNQTEYLEVPNGFEIQSVDEDGKMSWRRIEAVTRHDVPEGGLVQVKTLSGRSVKATVGKSFLVRRDNKVIAINGSELSIGDRLPVTRQAPEPTDPLKVLDVSGLFPKSKYTYSTEVRKAIDFMTERTSVGRNWWTCGIEQGVFELPYSRSDSFMCAYKNGRFDLDADNVYSLQGKASISKLPRKIELDELTGFFFGAYLSDGCANEYQVIISKKDPSFRAKIEKFATLLGIPYHIVVSPARNVVRGESTDIRLHSQMLAKVMRSECGQGSENKYIPSWSVIACRQFVKGLLDGYFSGDGTVNKRDQSIVASSSSEVLLLGIAELLSRFSIVCKKAMHQFDSNNVGSKTILPVHTLTIRNQYAALFKVEVGLTVPSKMEVLNEIENKTFEGQKFLYDRVPVKLSSDSKEREYLTHELQELLNNGNLEAEDRQIVLKTLNSDVYFDEIVSISPTSTTPEHNKVYDFTVEKTRTFTTLGGLNVMDTFHASGQASSASSVKDRFIRLVTASAAGKRTGTMILNRSPKTFYEAYGARNAMREITLASILKNPAPEMYYDVKHTQTVPALVRRMLELEHPSQASTILSPTLDNVCFIVFEYDPLVLKTAGVATTDLKRFLYNISVKNFTILPVVTRDRIYLFTTETNSLKARDGFQRNVVARLSDHKLNFGFRFSGEGMEELYPTEYKITDGIRTVYRVENEYVIQMNRRHMGRFGYTLRDASRMFVAAGVNSQSIILDEERKRLRFTGLTTSPVKLVESKLAAESEAVEAEWKASVEAGKPKEPENPGFVTSHVIGYYLKTIGGNMNFMMRNPLVNYRSSYTDGILEIEETLGLRAARNFMVHEIEQIFALSGANEIDYRHVVLMIDSMVSQGAISRLTFQGVDKMAGPNPLNQAGVGFAPAATFAMAALKRKEYAADAGYAVNFLASRPKIVRERIEEERLTLQSQEDKIKKYMAALPSLKKTAGQRTDVDYEVIKSKRQAERAVLDNITPYEPLRREPAQERTPALCARPVVAMPRAVEYDLSEYYDGFRNGLDIYGLPTGL